MGVQDKQTVTIRHSKNAPHRFAAEVGPALLEYTNSSASIMLNGINQAKAAKVATNDDERKEFLSKRGFAAKQAQRIIDAVVNEEGHQPTSVWDFVQGITAVARGVGHTDARIDLERKAGDLMDKVAR